MTMRTAPWRPTKRRDEEEASTSGRDAREIVNDLVPLEHFSRVIRGRAREGGSETCALGTRGWVAKEARAGADAAAKGWMRRWTSTRDAVGKRVRLERTCRAREAVVTFEHLCGTFDGLSLAAESSSSAEEVVASAATDPRAARYLSVPLGCADVDIVVHRWGFRTLRDLGTALAMERQVFGARRECGACGGIQTGTRGASGATGGRGEKHRRRRALDDERASRDASGVSRATISSGRTARNSPRRRAARLARSRKRARRVDETARRVGWKINDYRRKQTNSRTIEDAPRESDERAARALEVKATLSQARAGGANAGRESASATTSASKRARLDKRKPLVLKLREPKISILGSGFLSDAFGRDVTNTTSEKTRDAVRSVSKAAASVIRRNLFGNARRVDPVTSTPRDDVILRPFPKLPR